MKITTIAFIFIIAGAIGLNELLAKLTGAEIINKLTKDNVMLLFGFLMYALGKILDELKRSQNEQAD